MTTFGISAQNTPQIGPRICQNMVKFPPNFSQNVRTHLEALHLEALHVAVARRELGVVEVGDHAARRALDESEHCTDRQIAMGASFHTGRP